MLNVSRLEVGPLRANCYLIYNQQLDALIVDPGGDSNQIKQELDLIGLAPQAILLTHAHFDHIGAVDDLRDDYQIPVYLSPLEADWLADPNLNLSADSSWIPDITTRPADHELVDYQDYSIAGISFTALPTPGHTPGSISFLFEKDAFVICGDLLFKGTIGRSDFPGGDLHTLKNSIRRELFTLPGHFTVYPGHGEKTLIETEKKTNPFFNRRPSQ